MARTYRFNKGKDAWRMNDSWILRDWKYSRFGTSGWIDPQSVEGKKLIAMYHSDRKHGVMVWNGPSWFHRMRSQKPHRTRAKRELHKFKIDPEHEVIIENKPPRQYWW
jgi:hypothetical protein